MMDFLTELWWRAPITAVTAVLSAVVAFFAAQWLARRAQQRLRHRLLAEAARYAEKHGRLEVALVLSVVTDIRQAAVAYLDKLGRNSIQVFQVHQRQGFGARAEEWGAYLEGVKAEVCKVKELGATRVFLFANIPVALALFAGATLTNGPEVVVHHFESGAYLPIGRLTVETVRL